jgi:hypothetical protein
MTSQEHPGSVVTAELDRYAANDATNTLADAQETAM